MTKNTDLKKMKRKDKKLKRKHRFHLMKEIKRKDNKSTNTKV